MRAAVYDRYGPPEVVSVVDVPTPVPGDHDVLIRGHATAVNQADYRLRSLDVPRGLSIPVRLSMGFFRPKHRILGMEIAGQVQAVGSAVTAWQPGDRVVASRGFTFGAHAEYLAVPADGAIARIPEGVAYADAVSVLFGGATALDFLPRAKLGAGQHILINGASGAVGTMAVQLAKHMGAEVTGVSSGANSALVKSLGADHTIDYTKEDFTRNGVRYDVIMDNHGNAPFSRVKDSLKPGGRFVMVIGDMLQMLTASLNRTIVGSGSAKEAISTERYTMLLDLLRQGILKPVIDSRFPLERIVAAHRRVDTGRKVGSVIVTLA